MACFFHGLSLGAEGDDFAVSTLRVNDDTSLTLTSGLTDYGTGSRTVFTLIAAEVLGLKPERIRMDRPDTDTAIASGPTVASRATVLGGNAVRVTAERLAGLLTPDRRRALRVQPGPGVARGRTLHRPRRGAGDLRRGRQARAARWG